MLTLSDTDVYFDKQRYENNFSSIAYFNLYSLKEETIKEIDFTEVGRFLIAMIALKEGPQFSYNKAFLQYLKADEKLLDPMMNLSADRLSSMLKNCNLDPDLTRKCQLLLYASLLLMRWEDKPKSEMLDFVCKLVDAKFSTDAELMESVFRENDDDELPSTMNFDEEFPFPLDVQLPLDSIQSLVPPVIKFGKYTTLFVKSILASYLLKAEEFWQLLKKQAIPLEKVLTKSDGSFWLILLALSKLNADEFTELLTSVGVDSLKLSDEQFLDDNRNNILMCCVLRTTHFCIVADWALKQNCLDEMLCHRNCDGVTCFVLACMRDNFELVKVLLQKYHYDWLRDGFNAILALCENGNMLIFKHLLRTLKGDNVKMKLDSIRDSDGMTILMITTQNTKMMDFFLNFLIEEKLFDIMLYEKDALGFTCFFWAAFFQNIESIRMLIERYKYNWKTDRYNHGKTIAHIYCASKRLDVLNFLSKIMAMNL